MHEKERMPVTNKSGKAYFINLFCITQDKKEKHLDVNENTKSNVDEVSNYNDFENSNFLDNEII